jgi:hypothetical protein
VVLSLIKFKLTKSESLLNQATNAVVSGDFARANVLTESACVVMGFAKFKAEAGKITVLIPGPQSITIDDFDRISTDLTLARSLAGC